MNHLESLRSHVNWSPPFQGSTPQIAPRKSPTQVLKAEQDYYRALAKFEKTLARPEGQYEFTMKEGDLVFFDNRRVLHARRTYGEGERWLKGCYLDGEVVWDKLATM
jgi:gamma-butyrobetaine dioxygenase